MSQTEEQVSLLEGESLVGVTITAPDKEPETRTQAIRHHIASQFVKSTPVSLRTLLSRKPIPLYPRPRGGSVDSRSSGLETVQESSTDSDSDSNEANDFTRKNEARASFGSLKRQNIVHSDIFVGSNKVQSFELAVHVIEAQLNAQNLNPIVQAQFGSMRKRTSQKHDETKPFYDEILIFNCTEASDTFFDRMITIVVSNSKKLLQNAVIGVFEVDAGTVFSQPDHQFNNKWAPLLDPSNMFSGPKGYLKCSISICQKDLTNKDESVTSLLKLKRSDSCCSTDSLASLEPTQSIKHPGGLILIGETVPVSEQEAKKQIESNLLIPSGQKKHRQQARYIVRIHGAEGLALSKPSPVTHLKKKFTPISSNVGGLASFVKVSFAGHKARTSLQEGSCPSWNEQIEFKEMFPPFVQRIKIQLRSRENEPIGTHFIEFANISDAGPNGFIPTFGPTFLNLYGASKERSEKFPLLNQGIGEGTDYKGRLLVSLIVEVYDETLFAASGVFKQTFEQYSMMVTGPVDQFLLFGCVTNVTMLDKKFGDKTLFLEVSIGTFSVTCD